MKTRGGLLGKELLLCVVGIIVSTAGAQSQATYGNFIGDLQVNISWNVSYSLLDSQEEHSLNTSLTRWLQHACNITNSTAKITIISFQEMNSIVKAHFNIVNDNGPTLSLEDLKKCLNGLNAETSLEGYYEILNVSLDEISPATNSMSSSVTTFSTFLTMMSVVSTSTVQSMEILPTPSISIPIKVEMSSTTMLLDVSRSLTLATSFEILPSTIPYVSLTTSPSDASTILMSTTPISTIPVEPFLSEVATSFSTLLLALSTSTSTSLTETFATITMSPVSNDVNQSASTVFWSQPYATISTISSSLSQFVYVSNTSFIPTSSASKSNLEQSSSAVIFSSMPMLFMTTISSTLASLTTSPIITTYLSNTSSHPSDMATSYLSNTSSHPSDMATSYLSNTSSHPSDMATSAAMKTASTLSEYTSSFRSPSLDVSMPLSFTSSIWSSSLIKASETTISSVLMTTLVTQAFSIVNTSILHLSYVAVTSIDVSSSTISIIPTPSVGMASAVTRTTTVEITSLSKPAIETLSVPTSLVEYASSLVSLTYSPSTSLLVLPSFVLTESTVKDKFTLTTSSQVQTSAVTFPSTQTFKTPTTYFDLTTSFLKPTITELSNITPSTELPHPSLSVTTESVTFLIEPTITELSNITPSTELPHPSLSVTTESVTPTASATVVLSVSIASVDTLVLSASSHSTTFLIEPTITELSNITPSTELPHPSLSVTTESVTFLIEPTITELSNITPSTELPHPSLSVTTESVTPTASATVVLSVSIASVDTLVLSASSHSTTFLIEPTITELSNITPSTELPHPSLSVTTESVTFLIEPTITELSNITPSTELPHPSLSVTTESVTPTASATVVLSVSIASVDTLVLSASSHSTTFLIEPTITELSNITPSTELPHPSLSVTTESVTFLIEPTITELSNITPSTELPHPSLSVTTESVTPTASATVVLSVSIASVDTLVLSASSHSTTFLIEPSSSETISNIESIASFIPIAQTSIVPSLIEPTASLIAQSSDILSSSVYETFTYPTSQTTTTVATSSSPTVQAIQVALTLTIKDGATWSASLTNAISSEYKFLRDKVENQIVDVIKNSSLKNIFVGVISITFRQGSVIVDSVLEFNKDQEQTIEANVTKIFVDAVGDGTNLGNFTIDKTSIVAKILPRTGTQPTSTEALPGWGIAVIVCGGIVLLFLIVLGCILYQRRKEINKYALTNEPDEDTKYTRNWTSTSGGENSKYAFENMMVASNEELEQRVEIENATELGAHSDHELNEHQPFKCEIPETFFIETSSDVRYWSPVMGSENGVAIHTDNTRMIHTQGTDTGETPL